MNVPHPHAPILPWIGALLRPSAPLDLHPATHRCPTCDRVCALPDAPIPPADPDQIETGQMGV